MKDFVIAEPHLAEASLAALGDCPFVILACDGVWDVLTDQEAVELVLARFQQEGPFEDAAKLIVSCVRCHIYILFCE
jgi:serine/threonine protein phosphatase PrpC